MTQVSYFQRFSQKENTATNNTLLLLKYFYQENPIQFEKAINALADDTTFSIGPQFEQQKPQGNSVPDGLISQEPFEILIETKDGQKLNAGQIKRHLSGDANKPSQGTKRLLIGLTTSPTTQEDFNIFHKMASSYGSTFIAKTFSDIVTSLRESISEQDVHLQNILNDYEQYLFDDDLMPEGDILYGIPCGISMAENVHHKIYFEPAKRWSKSRGKYIGLYSNKCISYLGEPKTILTGIVRGKKFKILGEELGKTTPDTIKRIQAAIADCTYFPDFAKSEHRYYLFDSLEETEYSKTSRGGIWGTRRFDLDIILENKKSGTSKNMTLKSVASQLSQLTFE